jgi:hypothetical protein
MECPLGAAAAEPAGAGVPSSTIHSDRPLADKSVVFGPKKKEMSVNWKGVPNENSAAWVSIFAESREGLNLSAACPVCGAFTLHRYFGRPGGTVLPDMAHDFLGKAGLWEWCSSCLSFEHYSALVPRWWAGSLPVDDAKLTALPDQLDEALASLTR